MSGDTGSKFSSPASTAKKEDKAPSKFSSPNTAKTEDKAPSKFGSPATAATASKKKEEKDSKFGSPSSAGTGNVAGSSKPTSGVNPSEKARAAKAEESKRVYAESKAATAPPKATYTDASGKTVKVQAESSTVKNLRNKPASEIAPERRVARQTTIIYNNHYSHPYGWYSSQPYYYVGGGYSSAFWWIMMTEWSAERRADWLYNHRSEIDQSAYQRGVQDAQVQQRLAQLESQNAARNPDYVDKDFAEDPSLQYDQSYVEAAYNPTVVQSDGSGLTFLKWVVILSLVGAVCYVVMFRIRWGK